MSANTIKSTIYSAIAVVMGVVFFLALASLKQPPPTADPPPKSFNVQVFEAEAANLQEIIVGFGTAHAEHDTEVSAQVAGQIAAISESLKPGARVTGPKAATTDGTNPLAEASRVNQPLHADPKKLKLVQEPGFDVGLSPDVQRNQPTGQALLWIDQKVYSERLQSAKTAEAEAKSQLEKLDQEVTNNAKLLNKVQNDFLISAREHRKMIELNKDGTVTDSQLAQSQLSLQQYEQRKIELENIRDLFPKQRDLLTKKIDRLAAELELAKIDLARTTIRTPFRGIISSVMAKKGKYVTVGQPLFRVTNVDKVEIPIPLHSEEFTKIALMIQAGQHPTVHLAENESAPARWTGKVVRTAGEADRTTRTLAVYVEVDNTRQSLPLLPGSFVQARIDGPTLESEIVVPRDALLGFQRAAGKVMLVQDGKSKAARVKIARRIEGLAIVEGIEPGSQVIMSNLDVLGDGSLVEVREVQSLDSELEKQFTLRRATD